MGITFCIVMYFNIQLRIILSHVDMIIIIDSGTKNVPACTQLMFALQAGRQSC